MSEKTAVEEKYLRAKKDVYPILRGEKKIHKMGSPNPNERQLLGGRRGEMGFI